MAPFPVDFFLANKHWVTKEANLDRYCHTINLWLRTVGLGITEDHLNMNLFKGALFLISTIPFFLTDSIGILYHYYYVVYVLGESSDTMAVESALVFIACFTSFCKSLWILLHRRKICRMVALAKELGPVKMPTSTWVLTTIYVVTVYLSSIHRLIVPLRRGERVLPEENMLIPGLENVHETPDYELTYTINGVGFFTFLPNIVCFYALYIGLAGHITAHYEKLCGDFEKVLEKVTTIVETRNIDYDELKNQIPKLIEQHCKIIDVTNNVKMLFNSVFGFDFGMLTIGIGVLLIQISTMGVSMVIDFIGYYMVTLIVYCMPGEKMRTAADQLSTSVWSSGWEVCKPRERRSVLMVLRLAQKQQILTAGTFVPVTYQTLMKILKTCFSIYAAFDAAKGGGRDKIVEETIILDS